MKRLLQCALASLSLLTSLAFAAPACPLAGLEEARADAPQCYFFLGTAAYRDKDFELAAKHWKSLIALKNVPFDEKHWQVDGYNNLGFLYYTGLGSAENRKAAINYWNFAFDSGHDEAAYHLCHVYADRKKETFNAALGGQYCREALRRYGQLRKRKENREIDRQIKNLLKDIAVR